MTDVIVLTVPINGAYASMNSLDRIDRRKAPAYLDLFRSVREAARAAMAAAGWVTTDQFVAAQIVRYTGDMRAFNGDPANIGKCELDALSPSTPQQEQRDRCAPFPGVWTNDRLARPWHADIEFDPEGQERVVIILRRRFPNPVKGERRPAKSRRATIQAAPDGNVPDLPAPLKLDPAATWLPGDRIPDGFVLLAGKLTKMTAAELMRQLFGDDDKRVKR